MKRKIIWSFALLACLCCLPSAKTKAQTKNAAIIPGEVWKDTDGNPINAHGGGLLYHEGTYYWYGEYKKGETILPFTYHCAHVWRVYCDIISDVFGDAGCTLISHVRGDLHKAYGDAFFKALDTFSEMDFNRLPVFTTD